MNCPLGFRRLGLWAAGLMPVLLLSFCGCSTSGVVGPGMEVDEAGINTAPVEAVGPATRYVLMEWFQQRYLKNGGAADAVLAARSVQAKAADDIFVQWQADIVRRYAPYVGLHENVELFLDMAQINSESDLARVIAHLDALSQELGEPIPIQTSLEACLDDRVWQNASLRHKQKRFERWFKAMTFSLPDPPASRREYLAKQAATLHEALVVKQDFWAIYDRVVAAEAAGKPMQAVAELRKALARRGELEAIAETLIDPSIPRRFDRKLAALGAAHVTAYLKQIRGRDLGAAKSAAAAALSTGTDLDAAEKTIGDVEAGLSKELRFWLSEDYLAAALNDYKGDLVASARELSAARGQVWQARLKALHANKKYWESYELCRARLEEVQDLDQPNWHAYQFSDDVISETGGKTCLQTIQDQLWAEYHATLPEAYKYYLSIARKEVDNAVRHGISLGLCAMLDRMYAFAKAEAVDTQLGRLHQDAAKLQQESRAFFRNLAGRKLYVQEFAPEFPGVGRTFFLDLKRAFHDTMVANPYLSISIADDDSDFSPRDYRIHEANVSVFTIDQVIAAESAKTSIHFGNVEERENAAYLERVERGRPVKGVPPKFYIQDKFEHTVARQVIDLVSNFRMTFKLQHADSDPFHEIDHAHSESYVQEVLSTRELDPVFWEEEDEVKKYLPPPETKFQQMPSDSEMLSEARQEALDLILMDVMRVLEQYPLYLASVAREHQAAGRAADAANYAGYALEYCLHMPDEPLQYDTVMRGGQMPVYLTEDARRNSAIRQQLLDIKVQSWKLAAEAIFATVK